MLNHLLRRHWWYCMQLDLFLTNFWIAGTSLYAVKPSLKLAVSQQHTWGVNLLKSAKWYQRETGVTRKSCLLSSGLCIAERGESFKWAEKILKAAFWFPYQRVWPSMLKVIPETTGWFEVDPWSYINRQCIIHEVTEPLPCSSSLGQAEMCLLPSPGWLALWEGSLQSGVESREGCWYN